MKHLLPTFLTLALVSLACSLPVPNSVPTPVTLPAPEKPALGETPNALVENFLTAEVTAYQSLHVRNEPLGIVIGYLYHGDEVTLTGNCSDDPQGWAEIVWDTPQGTAWVNADFLSQNKCSEQE